MKEHITKAEIIKFATNTVSKDEHILIEKHLHTCSTCSKIYNDMQILLDPEFSRLEPSPQLKNRVMFSFKKAQQRRLSFSEYAYKYKFAFAAVIVILSAALFLFNFEKQPLQITQLNLSVIKKSGEIMLNNLSVISSQAVKNDRIITGRNSVTEISYPDIFSVKAAENTEIVISRAEKKIIKDFAFNLIKGILWITWKHDSDSAYTFVTGQCTIKSAGTEFFLISDNGKTTVFQIEGSVKIAIKDSAENITSAGKKYVISRDVQISDIQDNDLQQIKKLFEEKTELIKKLEPVNNTSDIKKEENISTDKTLANEADDLRDNNEKNELKNDATEMRSNMKQTRKEGAELRKRNQFKK